MSNFLSGIADMTCSSSAENIVTYDDVVKWWKSKSLSSIEEIGEALREFNSLCAYNSNKIEGIDVSYHVTRELFEDGNVSSFSGSFVDLMTVQNQKFATEYATRALADKTPVTLDLICKLHKIMLYGCYDDTRWSKGERPGEFKKGDYCVGLTSEGSLPEDVHEDLTELCNEVYDVLSSAKSDKIPTIASYFHLRFEQIHPFADGNGRVGRTLMNYILILGGYPPTNIFDEDKETYYLALEVFDRAEELSGFIKFVEEQTVKTWKDSMR